MNTQITHKLNINTKDLIQLLIDNGMLDEYFTNAEVNNLFISQVNNNEKVVQVEVGLNIGLDYLKAIEDNAREQFEDECDCEECQENDSQNETEDIIVGLAKAFGIKPDSFAVTKGFADYLNKALADERYKSSI